MSQLDSILAELKKTLAAQGVDLNSTAVQAKDPVVDTAANKLALKEFLSKNTITATPTAAGAVEDPKLIMENRNALSVFIGKPLTNNGVAALTGTISEPKKSSAAHKAEPEASAKSAAAPVPFTPPPMPVVQICPGCVSAEASKKVSNEKREAEEAAQKASAEKAAAERQEKDLLMTKLSTSANANAPGSNMMGGVSAPVIASVSAAVASAPSAPAPSAAAAVATAAKPAAKSGVAAFFSGLMPGKSKQDSDAVTSTAAPALTPQAAAISITWFKHIQAVESALIMGDTHFADSILHLLYESAKSVSADPNIIARLQSLQAKVMIERRQYDEAESSLKEMIQNLDSTPYAKNISAAYCWRALAIAYNRQKKSELATKANQKSIEIAEAALGPKDPEAMLFREALP